MKGKQLFGTVALTAAIWWIVPAAGGRAQGGRVMIGGVSVGRFEDPFLAAAEALVRTQGFKGDFAMLVGLSGLGDEATMCRQDCDCRETLHSSARLKQLVGPLRGAVTRWGVGATTPEAGWEALAGQLRAGRPLLAEGVEDPTSLVLVVGCDSRSKSLVYLAGGDRREASFATWTRGPWSFCSARLGTTQLPGGKAELDAVATMFAQARQPRIEDGCALRSDRTENAAGLQAYSLWSEQTLASSAADAAAKGRRVEGWKERRQLLEKFLRTSATHQNGDIARDLRAAADAVHGEVKKGLQPLAATAPTSPRPGADKRQQDPTLRRHQSALMQIAQSFQTRFLGKIEAVALRHLRVPKEARALVSMKPAKRPANQTANDKVIRGMLKSKDARIRTLGALAATRSGDAALAPELMGNLDSKDGVEARTALSALQAVHPDNLVGMLQKQVQTMGAAGAALDGAPQDKDGIGHQMQCAIEDLEAKQGVSFWKNPIRYVTRPPGLYWLLGLIAAGLGLAAWKILGPKRLASTLDEPVLPLEDGLPPEVARLEALLARPPATGLLITYLEPEGMAAKQGLEIGDIIVRYNRAAIADLDDLRAEHLKSGSPSREIAARRGLRTVKTSVALGPLGLRGVAVAHGETYWRRLATKPYEPDFSGMLGDGETWYGFTRHGLPCGFERRRWRWTQNEMELATTTGLAVDRGQESVRVTQRLRTGDCLTCGASDFRTQGHGSTESAAACTGGHWSVVVNGKTITADIPEEALPTQAMAIFASTLPFETGRAYNVIRIDECEYIPCYGYQMTCAGQEMVSGASGDERAWRFNLTEYGGQQMAFWFNTSRQLIRAEYAGLVSAVATREEALTGLPDAIRSLAADNRRARLMEPQAEPVPSASNGAHAGAGTAVAGR
jgi:hypothetical protein